MAKARREEVHMQVDAAGRADQALAGDGFGRGADDEIDVVHAVRIAALADCEDLAVAQADICLVDAGIVDDQDAGDDRVGNCWIGCARCGRAHAHAVTQDLAAAVLAFLPMDRKVALDSREQVGIAEAHRIACRRTIELGVLVPVHHEAHFCTPSLWWVSR